MEEKKLVPKLRFPGFTEPWEQRKLGEIVSAYSGGTPSASNKEYYGGDIPFIRSAEINNNHTELYITQKGLKDSSAKLVEKGTILYAMYGATSGEVSISQIDGAINQAILAMVPLMYDGEFIAQYLRRQKKNIINKYLQGGQGNLSANIVLNLQIQLPGVDEANQITSFFVKLDNLITLHQRKLEHLKLKKKSLLQKLFPKEGEVYPELRFPGFTNPWEQRKLGEVFGCLQNNTLSRDELNYKVPNVKNIHYGDILIKFDEVVDWNSADIPFINNNLDLSKYSNSLLRDGDIVFADTAEDDTVGKAIELQNVKTPYALAGLHTIPCRPLIPFGKGYMGNFLNSESYRCQLRPLMQGVKVSSISKQALKNTTIKYPLDLLEQSQIGNIFFHITTLLTLHQRKLEHLQLLKKALLQQLFV